MTKTELMKMDNVVVRLRERSIMLKVGIFLIGEYNWDSLDNYNEDLTNVSIEDLDIVEVGTYGKPCGGFKGIVSDVGKHNFNFVEMESIREDMEVGSR